MRIFVVTMKRIVWIILTAAACVASCSRSGRHERVVAGAERVVFSQPDSALVLLKEINPVELKADSVRALYYLVTAAAHKKNESSMAADSLTRMALEFYEGRDYRRFLLSADLYALHRFWAGDGRGALRLLDSVLALPGIPDSLMKELLASRIGVGGAEYDCRRNIPYVKRMLELCEDSAEVAEYRGQLCENYVFAGYGDSALAVIDELIADAAAKGAGEAHFEYTFEKIGILEELGRYEESNELADYLMEHAPGNSAVSFLHYWKALNHFNMGNLAGAQEQLALADSCALGLDEDDRNYYRGFTGPLHEYIDYCRSGKLSVAGLATSNNTRRDVLNRMESTKWETEQKALREENRALALKTQNDRQAAVIIIVALIAIIIALVAWWAVQKRARKALEAEERAETLQKMVDELSSRAPATDDHEALRRAMLRQLGVIKMVAEAPTEQNREMLRRFSSIGGDTRGALVDWNAVHEIVDSLYSGFYTRLHERYGHVLSDKEEQIVVLMAAGFSTKEISVITSQTAATIYVRKSAIRKKTGVPGKEDLVEYLNDLDSASGD